MVGMHAPQSSIVVEFLTVQEVPEGQLNNILLKITY